MNTADKGNGVDFAGEFTKWFAENVHGAAHVSNGPALLERMYSLGKAAAQASQAAAYRAGLEAASEVADVVRLPPLSVAEAAQYSPERAEIDTRRAIRQAIEELQVPEEFGGGK